MKSIIYGILLLMVFSFLNAAEPVINVPDLPPEEKLEPFELDDEVFIPKVLEAYGWAVTLQTQLEILGVEPKTKVFPPAYDELIELDAEIISSYHQKALALEKEVMEAPEDMADLEISELRDKIKKLKKEIFNLKQELFELELENQDITFYKNNNQKFMDTADSLRVYADSIKYHYYKKFSQKEEALKARYDYLNSNKIALITVAGSGHKFFFDHQGLENDISVGAMLTFNAQPLVQYGKYFELWAKYVSPRITTVQPIELIDSEEKVRWITDLYSFGISLTFDDLLRTNFFNLGVKGGAGFYWGESEAVNTEFADAVWRGEQAMIELNLDNDSEELPLEFYAAWNFYFPSKDLNFSTNAGVIPNGKENFYDFSVGLRMSLWNVPDYSKD